MTATNLGLGGNPVKLFNAYVVNVNCNLGLQQSPSTCDVTLAEDLNSTPPVVFSKPTMGQYTTLQVGSKFRFDGIITKYEEDIRNISGRTITVNLSDAREIMSSIPMILAPGFRNVVETIDTTGCSVVDVFGAYDDFDNTGINLSDWNQTGMTYERIALAFKGGAVNDVGFIFKVVGVSPKAFGEKYRFNLDEVTAIVDRFHRVNTNMISISDFIQELANRYTFDWYVTSSRNTTDSHIDVVIHVIDRSSDNVDIDLDTFLSNNDGKVVSAKRGFELRNELACAVLFGASVEQMRLVNITGLANNPVDLSDEGGSDAYLMQENEMRVVLENKDGWENWVKSNGDFTIYGISDLTAAPTISGNNSTDVESQAGINLEHMQDAEDDIARKGRIFEKLKGNAEASYGKRFLFQQVVDVDYIDAAWTADVVAGNNDPNEYFRNSQGKTRVFVEYELGTTLTGDPVDGLLGFGGNFAFGKGAGAAQVLLLNLRAQFDVEKMVVQSDKADWIIKDGNLFVSGTIEEGNIVKIDNPVIFDKPDTQEIAEEIEQATADTSRNTMLGGSRKEGAQTRHKRGHLHGIDGAYGKIHAKVYQPRFVHLPVRSKFTRYGPVFASNINADSQGKLLIENDDGFSPWEFGGTTLMIDAMQFKVDNSSSNVKTIEAADITIENFPAFSIGASLGQNSNINNITINLSGQVTTSYRLQSFLRRFGELSKEELASLSLFARRGGAEVLPQDRVAFINKYRTLVARQLGGRGSSSSSAKSGGVNSYE